MAVISVVKLSELAGAKRIDPEYYKPEYLNAVKKLKSLPTVRLKEIAFVTDGEHGSPIFDDSSGILYFSAQHVRDGYIDPTGAKYISKIIDERNKRSRLKMNDVLLSTVGTIGFAGLVTKKLLPANIDRHVARIAIDRKMDPAFVVVFLNSRYGHVQTIREATGNVQLNLFIDKIKELLIPVIDQAKIPKVERHALNLLDKSELLYSQAESLLFKELKLKDFKPKYELSYISNLSKAFGVSRVDAEYFQPAYDKIEERLISKFGAKPVGKINFIDVTTGQYSEEYVEKSEGRPYIRGTDIKKGTIDTDDLVYIAPKNQIENKKAKEGDVVVTRVGTIGLSARIPKECEGGTISDNLIRLRFDQEKLNSYYLALFLGSQIGVGLMIRNSRGSVQQRLNQETLKEVVVPILPDKTQQKIAALVQQSHEARKKAKEFLEEAKGKVEDAIEEMAR